jgi:hypothetical protein
MKDSDTQNKRLLQALRRGPINPMKALRELGIFRLAARALELKREGYPVVKRMAKIRKRFGEDTRVA